MILFVILLFIFLTLTVLAFLRAFYQSPSHREDPYQLPSGEQYQKNRESMLALIRSFDALPYESVTIRSFDGLRLFGRYYHVRDGAPLQIQMHGYRGTALRDFCGGNKIAREAGINTLVVDQRAHGLSCGKKAGSRIITMGIRERLDCQAWAQYAARRFSPETPVTLAGVSMGAATVLMASDLELPENVKGIIADCPYSSPRAILRKVISEDMHLPLWAAWPVLSLGAWLFGGFRLSSPGALDAVQKAKVPILLIHGEDDRFVPCEMSRQIARAGLDAGRDIQLETFPNAGHGLSFMEDRERYASVVSSFLEKCGAASEQG